MTKKTNKKKNKESFDYAALISLLIITALIIICICRFGYFGMLVSNFFNYLTGPYYLLILFTVLLVLFIRVFLDKKYEFNRWFYIGLAVLDLAVMILGAHLLYKEMDGFGLDTLRDVSANISNVLGEEGNYGGGLIGTLLLILCYSLFAPSGTIILLVALFMIAAILIIPLGVYKTILSSMKDTSSKVIDKARKQRDLLSEERKNRHYRQEEEKLRRHIEEEEKRKERRKATVPSSTRAEQLPLEENRSRFTRDFFIDDNRTQTAVKDADTKKEGDTDTKTVRKISKTASIKKNGRYKLPPLSLLEESSSRRSNINSRSAEVKGHRLIEVLANFGIDAELVNTHIGPSVTKFEIRPDSNIKIDKILNIQNNLKMELAAKDIRIEAPIPGRNAVGVEIPNAEMQSVRMCELMKAIPAKLQNSKLLFALGKDLMGKPVYCELNKMPHLLIAGATGSGKSVCMNTIICSLLLRTHPDEVKLVLVDPKKVEFSPYHDIPHLLWPVITESDKAAMLLKRLVVIMEERYETFSNAAVRDIASYNEYVERHNNELKEGEAALERMPFIVVIIDELADLMAVAKNDVQSSIQRFTQLARACGMHMIVATQRPSTDVITGLIKSNIPSRISFAVASSIDSRTILDCTGADKLLGNGDMLYLPQGESAPSRIQGAFVSDSEIRKITDCTKEQASPQYDDAYYALEQNGDGAFAFSAEGGNQKDPLYDQVVEFVREKQKASTSLLQRRFGIGYNRSARIIDELESSGIIGPSNGSKPREVYIKDDE